MTMAVIAALLVGACGQGASTDDATTPPDTSTSPSPDTAVADDCGVAPADIAPGADGPLDSQQASGDPLPALVVTALDDCRPVETTSWIGEPLVINFWASWCGPCVAEMPELADAAEQLTGSVRFIGVTFQDQPAASRDFLEEVPVPYDNFIDANGQDLFRAIAARGTPATVLVDADGGVVHRHAGPITSGQLAEAIAQHLGITVDVAG